MDAIMHHGVMKSCTQAAGANYVHMKLRVKKMPFKPTLTKLLLKAMMY